MDTMFEDKYNLTLKENLFLLRKHFSSVVYTGLKMENRNITFPQTEVILQGINDGAVALDDIYAILGMKHAIEVLIKNIDKPLTSSIIKKFNLHIAKEEAIESGVIRSGRVSISGTDYIPPAVTDAMLDDNLSRVLSSRKTYTEKAIDLFLDLIYTQYFWDGNKRTALLSANFLLCQHGLGLLEIMDRDMVEFATLLNNMFNTGQRDQIKVFLYNHCITGID